MKPTTLCTPIIVLMVLLLPAVHAATDLSLTTSLSLSLVNTDPDPAIAGDVVDVRLGVENRGGEPASNVVVEFLPGYPFTVAPGESVQQTIGNIGAYQGYLDDATLKIVRFKLMVDKDAIAGTYELRFKYYDAFSDSSLEKSLSLQVENRQSAEIIHINKTVLVPGEQTGMKFTIVNVGSAPLRELTFSWENGDSIILPVGSDNTKYVKYIDVGDSADVEYQVIADTNADPGLYKLNLHLTYDDPLSGEQKNITTIAGVYVGGGTDFDVAFSESSGGQMSFTIANVGSNPAFSVSVAVPQQQGWSVSGSNAMIIGNLNTGDYTVASFGLSSRGQRVQNASQMPSGQLSQGQQLQNKLNMRISYTDTMGKRQVVEKEVAVQQSLSGNSTNMPSFRGTQQQSFFSKYTWYLVAFAIICAVILVGIIRRKYKKEKLLNPHYGMGDMLAKRKRK